MLRHDKPLSEYEKTLLFTAFDGETDIDSDRIEKEIKKIKHLKEQILVKLLIFIPEYIFTYLIIGSKGVKFKIKLFKLYYNFYNNKITHQEFKDETAKLAKAGM